MTRAVGLRVLLALVWLAIGFAPDVAGSATAATCAQVKIQIKQKVSLERQAFNASMSIENGLDTPIQNISISLSFADATGNGVVATTDPNNTSATFFIAAPTLSGVDSIDGGGTIAAKTDGQIDWLLIPSAGAGGTQPQGALYYVGATLIYTIGSETKTIAVTPDFVTVKPQPLLALDYFLAGEVYADDAFTPQIEPPVPFTLGVRIHNVGGGTAVATTIESAQPRIVENKQGLAIGFQILDSYVNDQPAAKTLMIPFGNILPGASAVGRWNMVTTLSGKFIDITATYTHADALGGAATSLIKAINTHLLVHDVKVDLPGRDSIRDFLAIDGSTLRVYESDGVDTTVTDQSAAAQLQVKSGGRYTMSFPATTGFAYAKVTDPSAGQQPPGTVVRSDGKTLPAENVWLSKTRNDDLSWSYYLNLFDANTTGSYDVALSGNSSTASLAGTVYVDANGNGQQDAGESGIGAAPIVLSGTDSQGNSVSVTGYTVAGGAYSFTQLPAGTYTLSAGALGGYIDGPATLGSAGGTGGIGSISGITLASGAAGAGYAFAKRASSNQPAADLALTMSASSAQVKVGDTVTFHLTASNAGPDAATLVRVQDQLPAGLTWVATSTSVGSYDQTTGAWTVGSLASGSNATLDIVARVTRAGELSNAATAATTSTDANLANNTASAKVTGIAGNAKIRIGILASDYRVANGETATLLFVADNTGVDPAYGVTIKTVPTNLALGAGMASLGSYDAATGTWTIETLDAGQSASLVLPAASVGALAKVAATLDQIAGQAPAASAESSLILNPVDCGCADLGLTMSVSAANAAAGDAVDWTLRATNPGPNPAVGVKVDVPLPAAMTFVSAAGQGSFDAATGRWAPGTLYSGDAASITVHATAQSAAEAIAAGTISADQANLPYVDLAPADNAATAAVNTQATVAALRVTQTADKTQVAVDDTVTITLVAANDGALPVAAARVVDVLPAGLTYVSAQASQGAYDATAGLWQVGALAAGTNATLDIKARVAALPVQRNAAFISSERPDNALADNVARVAFNRPEADIAVSVSADSKRPATGQTVTLTIAADNLGPAEATGVAISARLPSALSLIGAAPAGYDPVTGLWKPGTLAANGSATLTLPAVVGNTQQADVVARLHETLSRDGNSANNEATLSLNSALQPILAATVATDRSSYRTGDTAHVTVGLGNSGTVAAQTIKLDLAVVDSGGKQVHAATQTVDQLAQGAGASLGFDLDLAGDLPGSYTVSIAGADGDGDPVPTVTANFAVAAPKAAISGVVFDDLDANGARDATDPGLAGVTVSLIGTDSRGAAVSRVAQTDTDGAFSFGQMIDGVYELRVTPSSGYVNTGALAGSAGGTVSPGAVAGIALGVDLEASGYVFAERSQASFEADIGVLVSASNAQPRIGDSVDLTVTLSNAGPAAARSVAAAVTLPAGLTPLTVQASVGSYDAATHLWTAGDIAAGAGATLVLTVRVADVGDLSTAVSVQSATADGNAVNNAVNLTLASTAVADMAITLAADNLQPPQNGTVTLTVTATNAGPSTASAVEVAAPLPGGLAYVAASATVGSYDPATGIWMLGNLASGASAVLSVTATVTTALAQTDSASVTSATADGNPANNTASVTLAPVPVADLSVSLAASALAPHVGDTVVLTVGVRNNGPSAASAVSATDVLPAGLTLISAAPSVGSYAAGTGTWTLGDLPSGGTAGLTLNARVAAEGALTDQASVASATADPNPADNAAVVTLNAAAAADLAVTLSAGNLKPGVGTTVTLTTVVTNAGPSAAAGVVLSEPVPTGLTFLAAHPTSGSYDAGSGTWTIGSLAAGANATLAIDARVASLNAMTATASVVATTVDANAANNTATITLNPVAVADLGITMSASSATPRYGDAVVLTIAVNNASSSAAAAVRVADLLPGGLAFVSATTTLGSYDAVAGVWTLGALAKNSAATLKITARVATAVPVTNTAIVTSESSDPNSANNAASVTLVPVAADLGITLGASALTPAQGDTVTLTIAVGNAGPSAATAATVTHVLPAGLKLVSATATTGNYNSWTGKWTLGNLTSGATATLTLKTSVAATGSMTDTVSVTSGTVDPNDANNTASVTLKAVPSSDLAVTIAANQTKPKLGDVVVFTIKTSNAGPSAVDAVTVTEILPAGLAYVSASTNKGSYQNATGVWTVGTLTKGGNATLTVNARVGTVDPITNAVAVSGSGVDSNPANNQASVTLTPAPAADLAIGIQAGTSTPTQTDTVILTLTASNAGPSAATGTTVTYHLPSGLSFVSAQASVGSYNATQGKWTLGDLAKSGSATLAVTARVDTAKAVTTSASVKSATFDPVSTNNSASTTLTPKPAADLALSANAGNTTPPYGGNVSLTVSVRNAGPAQAAGVLATLPLPAGLSLVSAHPGQGSFDAATGRWTLGNLSARSTATLQLTARVTTVQAMDFAAGVTATTADPNPANNSAHVTLTPPAAADLGVTLVADTLAPVRNGNVKLAIQLANAGPSPAAQAIVTVTLPAGLAFVSSATATGSYDAAGKVWSLGKLDVGAHASLALTARVTRLGAMTVKAKAAAATHDPNTADNTAAVRIVPRAAMTAQAALERDLAAERRLLVLVSCDAVATADAAACVAARSTFLDAYLTREGIAHDIVADAAAFLGALRCGQYNHYWLSGAASAQTDLLAGELQAAVLSGNGLLIDDLVATDAQAFAAVAGAGFSSEPVAGSGAAVVVVDDADFSALALVPAGLRAPLQPTTGTVVAAFADLPEAAAVVANRHGLGSAVTVGFDLLGALQAPATAPQAGTLLGDAFDYAWPVATTGTAAVDLAATLSTLADLGVVSSLEAQARDTAVELLRSALADAADQPKRAIAGATAALAALNDIAGADLGAERLAISRWLQQIERQWCAAQAYCSPAAIDSTAPASGVCGVTAP